MVYINCTSDQTRRAKTPAHHLMLLASLVQHALQPLPLRARVAVRMRVGAGRPPRPQVAVQHHDAQLAMRLLYRVVSACGEYKYIIEIVIITVVPVCCCDTIL